MDKVEEIKIKEVSDVSIKDFKGEKLERLENNQRKSFRKQFKFKSEEEEEENFINFFEELRKGKVNNMLEFGIKNKLPFSEHALETWDFKHLKSIYGV